MFNKSKTSKVSDISVLTEAIDTFTGEIDTLFADGGYDSMGSYQLTDTNIKVVIPPRINAVADQHTIQKEFCTTIRSHLKIIHS